MNPKDKERAISLMIEHLATRWKSLPVKVLLPVFPLLAKGRPVPIDELATKTKKTVSGFREELREAPVEWNEKEELINVFGFKLAPSYHRLDFGGIITFCCCALWLHFLPRLVGATAKVESIDPVSRKIVKLVMTPSGVESVYPGSAVATLVETTMEGLQTDTGNNFCNHVSLFYDTESASEWVAADPRRFLVDMKSLDEIAQRMCSEIWFK